MKKKLKWSTKKFHLLSFSPPRKGIFFCVVYSLYRSSRIFSIVGKSSWTLRIERLMFQIFRMIMKFHPPDCTFALRLSLMCYAVLSHFCWIQLFATLWTVAYQAPLSMGFSRQEYWCGLPFPSPPSLTAKHSQFKRWRQKANRIWVIDQLLLPWL